MSATRDGELVRRFINRAARRPLLVLVLLSSLLVPVGTSAASAPTNVKVFPNPPGQVCVSWNAYEGANQYKIYDGSGNFIQIAGTAAYPKCMPSDFGTCFAVSASTNSGETPRSAAVCASAPPQPSSSSGQQILTAATTSVSNCIPYPDNLFTFPNQPSIFCGQDTQGKVVCGGGDGGGGGRDSLVSGDGGTFTDTVFNGGYGRTSGGGGGGVGARDCELDGSPIDFQLPQIDYSTIATHDSISIEELILLAPWLRNLDHDSIDKVLSAVGCMAGIVKIYYPAYPWAALVGFTIDAIRAKTDSEFAASFTNFLPGIQPGLDVMFTAQACIGPAATPTIKRQIA